MWVMIELNSKIPYLPTGMFPIIFLKNLLLNMVKAPTIFIFSYRQIFPNTCQCFLKTPLLELGLVLEAELGMGCTCK